MSRPARRPSALAGSSTFDQPAPAPAAPPATAPPQNVAESTKPAPKEKPKKLTIYQEPEDTGRMRGAMVGPIPYEGFKTLSKFAQEAIAEKVERLEQKYNNGKPFPAVGPGVIPAGRPMGE